MANMVTYAFFATHLHVKFLTAQWMVTVCLCTPFMLAPINFSLLPFKHNKEMLPICKSITEAGLGLPTYPQTCITSMYLVLKTLLAMCVSFFHMLACRMLYAFAPGKLSGYQLPFATFCPYIGSNELPTASCM